jgi:polar amino acid transport system substrate-binding protein
MKYKNFIAIFLLFSIQLCCAHISLNVGILTEDAPAAYVTSSGIVNGIGPDFIRKITQDLPIPTKFIQFNDRKKAYDEMKKNNIQLLVGSFEEDLTLEKYNVVNTQPYFIDQVIVVSKKYELSIFEILALVFNRMFILTLTICLLLGVVFTFLLYFMEKDQHPHLQNCSRFEKLSYCFFTIFSCFFRDLLYDPVTTTGRTLFGVWMIISVFAITVISAIITSSILYLMDHGTEVVRSTNDLKNTEVGVLYGQNRLEDLVKQSGGKVLIYNNIEDAISALIEGKIEHFAAAKTNINKFFDAHYKMQKEVTVSNTSLGYETWVILGNEYFGQLTFDRAFVKTVNSSLQKFRNDFTMFNICSRYTDHPEMCVF